MAEVKRELTRNRRLPVGREAPVVGAAGAKAASKSRWFRSRNTIREHRDTLGKAETSEKLAGWLLIASAGFLVLVLLLVWLVEHGLVRL